MTITFIGIGLIGGSLAIPLRKRNFADKFIAVDKNEQHCKEALELGIVDEIMNLEEGVKNADLVVIAIPVDKIKIVLPQVLDLIDDKTYVIDTGSTKGGICKTVCTHKNRENYVAAHPIAGTENSGPKSALPDLFDNKKLIICEKEKSKPQALKMAEDMFNALKMNLIYIEPEVHDLHLAYVSHLPHISSYALALAVLELEKDEKMILDMAGSGFASACRLAKSSADMWIPIFQQNSKLLTESLDAYIKDLEVFKNAILENDTEKLKELINTANTIRKILT